ncbi:MAG TPA: ribonuclease III [Bacteroidota bacterium]|nr:ribonuclease III [Bacteroidota bacterium]
MSGELLTFFRRFFGKRRYGQRVEGVSQQLLDVRGKGFPFHEFEQTLGYRPRNWSLFIESLIHRSYLPYLSEGWNSNERLEFLGDAILNFIVADYLLKAYPDMKEGDLTKVRSRLVNRRILAQRARDLRMPEFMLLSSSATQSIDSGSESILADAFEAVVGALYLDGGMKVATRFVQRTLLSNDMVMSSLVTDDNYKSALLEYTQGRALAIPRYVIVREEGPDHDRRFTIEVYIGSESYGVGTGRSKKEAEQAAAAQALERLQLKPLIANT